MQINEYYPTSHKQRVEWHYAHNREEEESLFKIHLIRDIPNLDIAILANAYEFIIKKHESLRTNFFWINGALMLKVNEWSFQKYCICHHDLRNEKDLNKIQEAIRRESRRMPDYERNSLISTQVFRLSADAYRIVIFIEHIICDGWSFNGFIDELSSVYENMVSGVNPHMSTSQMQLKDYIIWKNEMVHKKTNWDYWLKKNSDDSYSLRFENLYHWYGQTHFNKLPQMKGKYSFCIDEKLYSRISNTAAIYKTSVPFLLVGLFVVLISRVFDHTKILVQMMSIGRYSKPLETLLANCTDFVYLFNEVDESKGIEKVIQLVAANFYDSLDYFYPWGEEHFSIDEKTLFRINYLPKVHLQKIQKFESSHEVLKSPGITSTSYLQFDERENGIIVSCSYSLIYYSTEIMEAFFSNYLTLIEESCPNNIDPASTSAKC